MAGYEVKKIDDMEAVYQGLFKRVRAELGISSFGIQVIDLPANTDGYPEHDHADDGQEEAYFVLRGSAEIEIDGERFPIDPDTAVRVSAGTTRKVVTGGDSVRLLIVGGCPGKVYEPPSISELGEPDPMAS